MVGEQTVLPGITYGRAVMEDPARVYHVVRVNIGEKELKLRAIKAALWPEQETIGKMAKRVLIEGENDEGRTRSLGRRQDAPRAAR